MKNKNYGWYAVAVAIVVVGALWAGLPVSTLAVFTLFLACPLMMFFMMRGMHGGAGHDQHSAGGPHDDEHRLPPQPGHHDSVR
jgi:Protein of unknown function (DUF2933)